LFHALSYLASQHARWSRPCSPASELFSDLLTSKPLALLTTSIPPCSFAAIYLPKTHDILVSIPTRKGTRGLFGRPQGGSFASSLFFFFFLLLLLLSSSSSSSLGFLGSRSTVHFFLLPLPPHPPLLALLLFPLLPRDEISHQPEYSSVFLFPFFLLLQLLCTMRYPPSLLFLVSSLTLHHGKPARLVSVGCRSIDKQDDVSLGSSRAKRIGSAESALTQTTTRNPSKRASTTVAVLSSAASRTRNPAFSPKNRPLVALARPRTSPRLLTRSHRALNFQIAMGKVIIDQYYLTLTFLITLVWQC
jgi:hypothetical protein